VVRAARFVPVTLILLAALAVAAPAASAGTSGVQHLHFRAGPYHIVPGQNSIDISFVRQKPRVDGYIVGIKPNLVYTDGRGVPRVDVLHLHHGVWLNLHAKDVTRPGLPERFFASGEEKTSLKLPPGYGYAYKKTDSWILNYMIHNLLTKPDDVYMTYDLDFIPASSPAAARIQPVRPVWMDVVNGSIYPVFDVHRRSGKKGRFTFPFQAKNAYPSGRQRNVWPVDRDGVLVATAGHLHPGGLHTDLWLQRAGARYAGPRCGRLRARSARRSCLSRAPSVRGDTAHLFQSKAKYWEPAGAVSWDVSMTATRPNWRVRVKKGDRLKISVTYDSKRGAWYESMGIMVAWMADGKGGRNPFKTRVDYPGRVTHGHLAENNHHGGKRTGLPDARNLGSGVFEPGVIGISDFRYAYGDLRLRGERGRPPVVKEGGLLRFSNGDNSRDVYHSVTSCRTPCNRSTGVAYPLADGRFEFDSGQLGRRVPAVGRTSWTTRVNLPPGTYNYFCRIHPFMRGAFRVKR
jgi:hypothetical protein